MKAEKTKKNFRRMPERCRNIILVSEGGNWGNKKTEKILISIAKFMTDTDRIARWFVFKPKIPIWEKF
jgi:hypothetical protein